MTHVILHPEMERALDAIRDAAWPVKPFTEMASLALCAVQIAQQLAAATAIEAGVPTPPWESLPVQLQQKCLRIAERALAMRDPDVRLEAAVKAERAFAAWMNAPYGGTGTEPTHEEMAAKAIALYEERLAHPLVRYERGCYVCGGILTFAEDTDTLDCESCGRAFRRQR